MKIYPGGAQLFHADRQPETVRFMNMMKLTVAFCNFVNAPTKKNLGKKTIYRVDLYKQTVKVVTAKCVPWCFGRFLRLYKHQIM
jgi:hypothetical protein